jgi:hypothetical protein
MLSGKRRIRGIAVAMFVALLAALACSPLDSLRGTERPSVEITSPPSGTRAEVGQTIEITSVSSAEAGVGWVELLVDGELVSQDEPPSSNPTPFWLVQSWEPEIAGDVEISVVAYDADGQASEEATILVSVAPAAAELEPTATPTPEEEPAECTLQASLVSDLTIPAGTEMEPGTSFVKSWRVENAGTCDWPPGFSLLFASGDQMGGPASVPVPQTAAGGTVDLNVSLEAPSASGTYSADWRLRSDTGQIFGEVLTVEIVVPAPSTGTPTVTPTPLPTHTATPTPLPTHTPTPTSFFVFPTSGPIFTGIPFLPPVVERVHEQRSLAAGDIGYTTATCPSGSVVVSGGYGAHPDVLVYTHRTHGNGWRAYAKNNTASSRQLTVYATCLRNVSGATTAQVKDYVTAPASDIGHAVVSCPAGSVVTGGGWAGASNGSLWVYNSSRRANGWQVYAQNRSGSARTVTAYALCLSGSDASTRQIAASVSVASGATGGAGPTCGADELVTGGGFASQDDMVMYSTLANTSGAHEWWTYAENTGGENRTMHGYAICLSFP